MVLDALRASLDELVATDPARLADADTVVGLHRHLDRLQCAVTHASGAGISTAGR